MAKNTKNSKSSKNDLNDQGPFTGIKDSNVSKVSELLDVYLFRKETEGKFLQSILKSYTNKYFNYLVLFSTESKRYVQKHGRDYRVNFELLIKSIIYNMGISYRDNCPEETDTVFNGDVFEIRTHLHEEIEKRKNVNEIIEFLHDTHMAIEKERLERAKNAKQVTA